MPGPFIDAKEMAKYWIKRAEAAEAKVAKLREALAFYADKSNWKPHGGPSHVDCDEGQRARQALTETEEQSNG